MSSLIAAAVAISAVLILDVASSTAPPSPDNPALECRQFQQIYTDGKDLCERIFNYSYKYVPRNNSVEYSRAYTMWFFESVNPNDAVTQARIAAGLQPADYQSTDVCWLATPGVTNHKSKPSDESDTFTECLPFRKHACCKESTVENASVINLDYGAEYRWDRCGKLSPECERFFVQEACFYECDPNAGLFRMYPPDVVAADPNLASEAWEVYQLPIKGDYCDAWFESCREQLFCGDGDFFECARIPPPSPAVPTVLPGGAIAGIVIGSIVLVLTCIFVAVLIRNERRGTPVFHRIPTEDSHPLAKPSPTQGPSNPTDVARV